MEIKERGIGKINLNGKEYGFHMGTYQSKVFCGVRGLKLSDYLKVLSELLNSLRNRETAINMENNQLICDLLYSALVAYCTYKKQPIDFNADEVTFWADMAGSGEIAKLFTVIIELDANAPKNQNA